MVDLLVVELIAAELNWWGLGIMLGFQSPPDVSDGKFIDVGFTSQNVLIVVFNFGQQNGYSAGEVGGCRFKLPFRAIYQPPAIFKPDCKVELFYHTIWRACFNCW